MGIGPARLIMPFPEHRISNWHSHRIVDEACMDCGRAFPGKKNGTLFTKEDATMTSLPGGKVEPCR